LFKDNSLDAPVKLCDFGFAKIDQGDLMTPQFTPYYVAPQVLEAQRRRQKEKSGIIPTSPTPYTYNKSCDLVSPTVTSSRQVGQRFKRGTDKQYDSPP
uniref:Protein kinase domain-containing protein n=1 Tax=Amphiprion ocellaris TaxID=80972 RepID=A0A3Q1AY77_AMPOC